ncbi:MAG: hypoxanthine phosphoribosyltransferase [Bacteroidota bacterium]
MNEHIMVNQRPFKPLISEERIQERIKVLGKQMTEQFKGKRPLMIGILNGAFVFFADLCRVCDFDCDIAFTRLSSYTGTQSSGEIKTILGLQESIKGRDIIVVEDIVDTGETLHHFIKTLQAHEAASISLAVLLVKPDAMRYHFPIDYKAFEISNEFVIGYGLDYDGLGRNLNCIYQLDE